MQWHDVIRLEWYSCAETARARSLVIDFDDDQCKVRNKDLCETKERDRERERKALEGTAELSSLARIISAICAITI